MSRTSGTSIKRVYDAPDSSDGVRILVDRLWPRGVSKAAAALDAWEKEAAPSPELRSAWHADPDGHAPDHFQAFADEYRAQLREGAASEAVDRIAETVRSGDRVTLLYAAKDERVNHAVVLLEEVEHRVDAS